MPVVMRNAVTCAERYVLNASDQMCLTVVPRVMSLMCSLTYSIAFTNSGAPRDER